MVTTLNKTLKNISIKFLLQLQKKMQVCICFTSDEVFKMKTDRTCKFQQIYFPKFLCHEALKELDVKNKCDETLPDTWSPGHGLAGYDQGLNN